MRKMPALGAAVGVLTLALMAGGCGTTADPETDDGTESSAQESSTGEAATDAEAIVLTDEEGNEVTLDAPATRVVALEWAQAEILSSLGVELAGVSDVAGYESWVGAAVPLVGEPEDVGQRAEPSVETIAALEPDLIVGVARSIPDEVRDQMEQIAPILLLSSANATDPLETVKEGVETLAAAVGLSEQGDALNEEFDAKLAENAEATEAAGLAGTPIVLTAPYADGNSVQIRMHGPGSAPQAVMTAMGFTAAWTDPGDEGYGLSYTDVEGLTALAAETWFLYWANADEDDPLTTYLEPNAVWASLPFVQEGRVAGAAEGIWVYGGPASLMEFSDDVLRVTGAE